MKDWKDILHEKIKNDKKYNTFNMRATLTFETRYQAEEFAKEWSRKAMSGHTIHQGDKNVKVDIYNITDELKIWIDNYVSKLNS
tara:strand:- start:20 stop:271 length:252 start_codon:yes stop_codon:yes gene_type:complete